MPTYALRVVVVLALAVIAAPYGKATAADPVPDPVIAAVGDIACNPASSSFKGGLGTATACRQQYVADLITGAAPDAFLALGDIQYEKGELANFRTSYDKAFGPLLPITHPAPGNHEWLTGGAAGYAAYFGEAAPYRYSTTIGAWHVIALDSNCGKIGGCGATSPQGKWLTADLAANPAACTLAFWHHPRFNSGEHGGATNMTWTWRTLYNAGADVVLAGHEHAYTRFAPMRADGVADPARGIRSWVVGTGGKSLYQSTTVAPNTDYTTRLVYGALFMTLHPDGYDWQFRAEGGGALDTGSAACH
jgi:hypothetical protein